MMQGEQLGLNLVLDGEDFAGYLYTTLVYLHL